MAHTNVQLVSGNLTTGGEDPTFFIDRVNNKIGIGGVPDTSGDDSSNVLQVTGSMLATAYHGSGEYLTGIESSQWLHNAGDATKIYYNGGNVGIGVDNPNSKLVVDGDIDITNGSLKTNGTTAIFSNWATDTNGINRNGNVGIGGDATATNTLKVHGDIYATGDVIASSDRRLKTDIKRIENALDKVCAIGGYMYMMNDKPSTGLIAQEVLEVLPEVVHGSEETSYSLAYGNVIGLLVEAIKELKEKIG